jgi:D-alanine-D-alanine ligase
MAGNGETRQTQVLHLMGSSTSSWYFDLSIMYGRTAIECPQLDRSAFNHRAVILYTSGKWGFPSKVDDAGVAEAEKQAMNFGEAMATIQNMQPAVDVCVPHMFCVEGLTRYRTLIDLLGIELLGCSGEVCAVAQDKFVTKAVCEAGGVPVPKGELLRNDLHGTDVKATAQMIMKKHSVPFIVKPAKEDNSIGLSLVRTASLEDVIAALTKAFKHDEHILVEEYIPGRELRVAVLEVEEADGIRLVALPKIEYVLEDIRTGKHKLGTDANGKLLTGDKDLTLALEKGKEEGERICPARLTDEVQARVDDLAKKAHKALGCKYYSLYDVRLNPDGMPFMLEACLFCSFSPYSVIVSLAAASDFEEWKPHPKLFERLLLRAARETETRRAAAAKSKVTEESGALKKRMRLWKD